MAESCLESFYVGVSSDYLIFSSPSNPLPPIASSYPEQLSETSAGRKKRPRDNQVNPEDRICQQTKKGAVCPFGDQCKYSHDILKYLESKPPDLGPRCHEYDTYGFCRTGFMCRYGDSHIDRVNGVNLLRPESQGGVIERPQINLLSKELQVVLRKKKYSPPVVAIPAQSSVEEKTNDSLLCDGAASSETMREEPFNSTPYASDSGTRKLIDFSEKVYVAPLTTIGNLPFRRILRDFGADITCGEVFITSLIILTPLSPDEQMAMANNINAGQSSEWALLKRHESETLFGLQIASGHPNELSLCAKVFSLCPLLLPLPSLLTSLPG
jgi:tRNA-dihydrouridine synthase 3